MKHLQNLFFARIVLAILFAFGLTQIGNAQIASWNFFGAAAPATWTATTFNANLVSAAGANNVTRGAGAAASAGGNSFRTTGFSNNGIATTNTDYFQVTLTAAVGYSLSLSTIDAKFAGTATFAASPGVSSQFAYSLNGTTFTLIGSPSVNIGTPATLTQINVSSITALQNVPAGTTVTLRYYASGQTTTGGWGFISATAAAADNGLAIGGTVNSTAPKLAITNINPASPTQNSNFDVTVQSQDGSGNPLNLTLNTDITLTLATGTGTLSGSTSGTMISGTNTKVFTVAYDVAESGVSITATASNGDPLTPATSSTFTVQPAVTPPSITLTGTLTPFTTVAGTPSATQSYSVSGANLGTTDITITPPADFEIRTGANAFSNAAINLTPTGGTVSSTTIDVRYNPAIVGSTSGNITHVSGAASQNQPVSGNAIEAEPTVASTITIGTVTTGSAVINFSGGNGASRMLVMAESGTTPTWYAITDGFGPTGVNSNFPSASSHGGTPTNRIVYAGTGNSVTVTGLNSTSTYYVSVYEYNGTLSSTNYLTSSFDEDNFTTPAYTGAIPVPMISQGSYTYTENFADIANWGNNFNGGTGAQYWGSVAINATGTIPDGVKTTKSSATFATTTGGGVQRGSLSPNPAGTIVLLSTGSPDNTEAVAIDFLLDFTGLNAGTLSFDWSVVLNGSTGRPGSLRVYSSIDGTTFSEITAAAVLDFSSTTAQTGSIVTVALPASFNNSPTARLRFYEHNGSTGLGGGNRPKIAVDNVVVTGSLPAPPDHLAITNVNPASPGQYIPFSVTVQAQDPTNVASNVAVNTDVTIQLNTGTGTIGGTFTGTILAGTSSVVISGITYDIAEYIILTAHRTAGDALADGNSGTIQVLGPAITVTGTLNTFVTPVSTTSSTQSYTVSGSNLTTPIIISPPSPFEISDDNGATWVVNPNSISLALVNNAVATTTILVRYSPVNAGPHSGNITHTSTNAVSQNQPVSGSTVTPEPTTPSTVSNGCITTTSMVLNFTGGDGSSRIVVMKAGGAVTFIPTDGTASTGVNSDFSLAADQGSGDRIVYDGNGNTATVTGLTSGTTYAIAVYEYNGSGAAINYLETNPGVAIRSTNSGISYSNTGSNYTQNFDGLPNSGTYTTSGFGAGPYYLTECPIGANNMGGWQYHRAGTAGDVLFKFDDGSSNGGAVVSYGTTATTDRALGSLASGSIANTGFPAWDYGLIVTNNTPDVLSSVTISYVGEQWRDGGGIPNSLTFSYSLNGTSLSTGTYTTVPALDFNSPVNTNTGTALNGNSPANQSNISATFNLSQTWNPGQTLIIKWVDINDAGNDHALAIDDFVFSANLASSPTVQDFNINFTNVTTNSMTANWTNGDGQKRVVIMNTINSFTDPNDGTDPVSNSVYGGVGEQVVYNGTGSSVNVTNLLPNVQYWFRVYGYNGIGATTAYLVAPAVDNPNSQTTSQIALATQLVVLSVNGGVGVDVVKDQAFSVVVQAQDANGVPQNVILNTTVDLAVFSGSGTLNNGNSSGVMTTGTNTVTITGVKYDVAEAQVVLEASRSAGENLTSGLSAPFDVKEPATTLVVDTVPPSGVVNQIVGQIRFKALRPDLSLDNYFTGAVTLAVNTGAGTISGTTTVNAVGGVASFNDIVFSATGPYTVTATSTGLSATTSSTIYITDPQVLSELVVPQYIGIKTTFVQPPGTSTNVDRTPIAVCLQINNLVPNTAYDIRIGVDSINAPNNTYGGSNIWTGAAFVGNIITNAFTTDALGNSPPKWVYIQPATSRFEPAMVHNLRIGFVQNGFTMPASPNLIGVKTITALDHLSTARTATTADDGAFIQGSSVDCISGKYVLFYDNTNGTGEPLYSYQARVMDATNTSQTGLPVSINDIFRQGGSSVAGDYAGVIPTNNANGVQRIEVRNADNSIFNYATSATGMWGTTNTVNPVRHSVSVIAPADAPLNTVVINSISSTAETCVGSDGTATVNASIPATTSGTLSYSWSPSGGTAATATGLAAGTYTVTVSNSNGCSATASVVVGAPSSATITPSGPTTFCTGGSVTLSAGSAASWAWFKDNIATGETTQSIVVTTSGSYKVTVDDGFGCTLTSAPTTVLVNSFGYNGTIYSESMGTPTGNTLVNNYTGWQNTLPPITYQSTSLNQSDVRTTSSSTGYPGASGTGNVFFTTSNARNFIISGINTLGFSNIDLSFGLRRDAGAVTDLMVLEYSTDGTTFTPITITQPATNNAWGLQTISSVIPATGNLRLRFSKNNAASYRLDDVKITGTTTSVEVAASGTTNLCPGTTVRLTSNIPLNNPPTNVWSNTATTKSILLTTGDAGTYTVTVSDVNGCTSTSAPIVVQSLIVDDGNACTADACNSITGVVTNTPSNTDDGNACTIDNCNTADGTITNTPVNVDDGNACTTDACDSNNGNITHDPISVDDSNLCTIDACDSSNGNISHNPVPVDDGDPCTADACNTVDGSITHTNICAGSTLYAKVFIEGYYTTGSSPAEMNNAGSGGCLFATGQSTDPTDADYLTISAMDATTYQLIESQTAILKTNGTISVTFGANVLSGVGYYLKFNHRNSLETWSGAPVIISATTSLSPFDLTSAASQAYGNNLSEVEPGLFAIYGGDISDAGTATVGVQDGIIESQDYGDMENAVYVTLIGYVTEDITGDGIVESADYGLMENNVYYTRVLQRPY